MSTEVVVGLIALGGVLGGVIGSVIVAKITTHSADRASSLDGWEKLAKEYRTDRDDTRKRLDTLEEDMAKLRRHVAELEAQRSDLEAQRDHDHRWKGLARRYIRQLREALTAAGVLVPEPPTGLSLDDPE